jgi:hypothetical protein
VWPRRAAPAASELDVAGVHLAVRGPLPRRQALRAAHRAGRRPARRRRPQRPRRAPLHRPTAAGRGASSGRRGRRPFCGSRSSTPWARRRSSSARTERECCALAWRRSGPDPDVMRVEVDAVNLAEELGVRDGLLALRAYSEDLLRFFLGSLPEAVFKTILVHEHSFLGRSTLHKRLHCSCKLFNGLRC